MAVETASWEVRTLGDLVELSLVQIRISSPLFGQQTRRWGRPCSPIASAKGPVNSSSRGNPSQTGGGRLSSSAIWTASASRGDLVWTGSSFVLKTKDLTCPTGHSRR